MFQPNRVKIPEGRNFIGWFESEHSTEQVLRMFESEGWSVAGDDRDYTLTETTIQRFGRMGGHGSVRIYKRALTFSPTTGDAPYMIYGQLKDPKWLGREIRAILWRQDQKSNSLVCLWRDDAGEEWRDIPATAERLGLSACQLSDEDQMPITKGFIRQRVAEPVRENQASPPFVEARIIEPSVVVDDEGIRHYAMYDGISRIEWRQVQEVSVEGVVSSGAIMVSNFVTIRGDGIGLSIPVGTSGLPALIDRLAQLSGFPKEQYCEALERTLYDEEVVVWRRTGSDER